MTIIDETGDAPEAARSAQRPADLPAPTRATFGEAVAFGGDELAGLAGVIEAVGARLGAAPAIDDSVSLSLRSRTSSFTIGRAQALDLAAGLLELADTMRAAGMVLEGLALEGLQARVLEALIGAGR